jgi:hypothetical protein
MGYEPQASGLMRNNGRVSHLVAELEPRVA